ncbi:hypothetical protein QL285_058222 [Trifolium repens]|nr:hypothetical protein QL285_058222 [Trifolium repens]
MASSSTLNVDACMILTKDSNPTVFAKDQRPYKYDDLSLAIENPVDLEGLRVNGFPEVVDLFKRQGMEYYFDVINGPTYTELVKEFWMKASVITKEKYNQRIKEMIEENPELEGKTPKEMGLRPFVATKIESFVAGFRISIRLCHIYEALKLERGGLVIRNSDEVGSDVEAFIFKPKANPKDKFEMTNNCKVIYKILIDSIMSKLGGTDQISNFQKLFTFHVGKGNFLDIGKLIFIHLADSILSTKTIVRHSRLLSHMFAQCGLLDTIKPFLPGYGTFLTSYKVVNSTTLRYLKLVKSNQIIHQTHPLLLRDSEENIAECRLVHVSDSDARKVIEAHAEYLKKLGAEVGTGEPTELSIRQSRILEQPTRVYPAKRKVVKSPVGKKVAKTQKTTAPRSTKKPKARKIVLKDLTDEEKEKADFQAALEKINQFNKKQEALKDTYDSGIEAKEFDDMYSKLNLSERDALRNMSDSVGMYGPVDGKSPTFIAHRSSYRNVFQKLKHPPVVKVKRAYDRIFQGVGFKKDLNLSENQPLSEQFNSHPTNPSESQTNNISNDAAQASGSSAPVILTMDDEEDSDRTPSPHPPKYDSLINREIAQEQPLPENTVIQSPEPDQNKQTPLPENEPQTPTSEHNHSDHETHKSPEPTQNVPVAEVAQKPDSEVHAAEKSPHHVAIDNSCTIPTPLKKHFQQINDNMNLEVVQKTPPHQTNHLKNLIQDLSLDCIFVPPHLPSRIINEPLEQTQEDISNFLIAVDKNIRRMSTAIPNKSIETVHINKECDLMEENLVLMIRSVREAYTKDLDFRNEMARKEEERLLRERLEAEEWGRKRLEDERIEKERQEAQAREEARLAEEARIAAEQARLENIARNAPEYAQFIRENQENMQRKIDEHANMLASILTTLQSINERLPPPPQP